MSSLQLFIKAIVHICLIITFIIVLIFYTIKHFETSQSALPGDCALVFGAVVYGEGQLSPALKRRVESAVQAYKSGLVQRLIMTGGKGRLTQQSEANVMMRTAIRLGVPASDIYMEDLATSTWENIALSKPLLHKIDCTSVIAFSDEYHIARILYTAQLQSFPLTAFPISTTLPNRLFLTLEGREILAIIAYSLLSPYYLLLHISS